MSDYSFAAQHQQNPIPEGGGLFKEAWFPRLDCDPEMLATFITVDTAETDKSYNDATVFNFLGVYKVKNDYADTDEYGLHCIDCDEIRVEPADLENCFRDFYTKCLRYKKKPSTIGIEKKSMGVLLCSMLKRIQGLDVTDIERTKASGSKTTRFIEMQSYIKKGLITFTKGAGHTQKCIEHMSKITDNNAHKHDDICDTFYDGVKLSLIDKIIQKLYIKENREVANRSINLIAGFNSSLSRARGEQWRIQ